MTEAITPAANGPALARVGALRRLLEDAHRALALKLGFRLWDGSRVPADWPEHGLMIAIADEGVIATLLHKPRLDSLIQLHVAGRLDLVNGTPFDLVAVRPEKQAWRAARSVSKRGLAEVVARFLFVGNGAPSLLAGQRGDRTPRDGKPETNRANIAHHYDVSNEFYALFLDPEMVYSCAYFTEEHEDIARAQRDKLDMICRKLRLKPGDRFLDIGCGWGALVCHAAQHYGVEAHGVTLAKEQLALAEAKVKRLGLEGRVTLHLKDYRQMEGEFDKIASIGMFEHVGLANHRDYFQAIRRLLRPRGLYLHHAITRRAKKTDRAFKRMPPEYRALVRYIFPGGEIDHLGMSIANLERNGFEVHDVEGWRENYQRTTYLWWKRLQERRGEAEALVGPEKTRLWLVYLAGCSLAFERGGALVNQTLASRRVKGSAGLPMTRADLYDDRTSEAGLPP